MGRRLMGRTTAYVGPPMPLGKECHLVADTAGSFTSISLE